MIRKNIYQLIICLTIIAIIVSTPMPTDIAIFDKFGISYLVGILGKMSLLRKCVIGVLVVVVLILNFLSKKERREMRELKEIK